MGCVHNTTNENVTVTRRRVKKNRVHLEKCALYYKSQIALQNTACIWRWAVFLEDTSGVHQRHFSEVRGHRIFNVSIKESGWQGNVSGWDKGSLNYIYCSFLSWSGKKMIVIILKTRKQCNPDDKCHLTGFSCSLQVYAGWNRRGFVSHHVCLKVKKYHSRMMSKWAHGPSLWHVLCISSSETKQIPHLYVSQSKVSRKSCVERRWMKHFQR